MTNNPINIPSVDVLMNRGFRATVNKMFQNPENGVWDSVPDETEITHLRLDNWLIALIERDAPEGFGSLEAWQEAIERQMFRGIAKTVAIIEEKFVLSPEGLELPDVRYGAKRMVDGGIQHYAVALTNALMLAQGLDPKAVADATQAAFREIEAGMAEAQQEMVKESERLHEHRDDALTQTSPNPYLPTDSDSATGHVSDVPSTSTGV